MCLDHYPPRVNSCSKKILRVEVPTPTIILFVSLVYCAENTVRRFVVREKHCWMAADSADKSKRTGRIRVGTRKNTEKFAVFFYTEN
jgi:hypothetical protein